MKPRRRIKNCISPISVGTRYKHLNGNRRTIATGNGKIDLIIQYQGKTYGIEIKSFIHHAGYRQALPRTAKYGHQLGLEEIYLVSFLDRIDDKTREIYETYYHDPGTGVTVKPIFIQTGDV